MSGSINKRVRSNDEGGRWEGLNPEVLALIFVRLPAEERVRTVGLVCRSWLEAVAGPFCWTEIDIEQWGRRCNRLDFIDLAVKKLVRRSKFTFRRLSAYKLGDSAFSYLANWYPRSIYPRVKNYCIQLFECYIYVYLRTG